MSSSLHDLLKFYTVMATSIRSLACEVHKRLSCWPEGRRQVSCHVCKNLRRANVRQPAATALQAKLDCCQLLRPQPRADRASRLRHFTAKSGGSELHLCGRQLLVVFPHHMSACPMSRRFNVSGCTITPTLKSSRAAGSLDLRRRDDLCLLVQYSWNVLV